MDVCVVCVVPYVVWVVVVSVLGAFSFSEELTLTLEEGYLLLVHALEG